jgi:hypothetical protein
MGLLGDLPSLEGMLTSKKHTPSKKEIMQLDLELPEKMKVSVRGGGGWSKCKSTDMAFPDRKT